MTTLPTLTRGDVQGGRVPSGLGLNLLRMWFGSRYAAEGVGNGVRCSVPVLTMVVRNVLLPSFGVTSAPPQFYVEPFAGSLACLLARPGGAGQREIVCDLDGGIVNFWRAMEVDPDEVAYWADYPSFHQDLTARHKWLKEWFVEHASELSDDPHFCDSKVAGWWVWGISLWIGGGWCHVDSDKRPQANNWGTGQGVSAQKITRPRPSDMVPSYPGPVERCDRT